MRFFLFVFLIFLSTLSCLAQQRIISVRLLDALNKSPISNVTATIEGSTRSAFSNKAGYFQSKLEDGDSKIKISHIGYETSEFQIPKHNVFTILVNRDYTRLPDINLSNYPIDSLAIEIPEGNSRSSLDDLLEHNALYIGGWEKFHFDLGNSITQSQGYIEEVINGQIQFSISSDSTVTDVMVMPDTLINKEIIVKTLKNMNQWHPALQNGKTTIQNFTLKINGEEEKYEIVEVQPSPKDGMSEFCKYVAKTMKYPQEARRNGIEGRVFVQFVVDIDGNIIDVKAVKGIGFGCDEEAVRAVSSAPNWSSGTQDGKPVKVRIILPITFSIGSSNFSKVSYPEQTLGEIVITAIGVEGSRNNRTENTSPRLREKDPEFPGGSDKRVKYFQRNKKVIDKLPPPNKFGNRVKIEFTVDVKGKTKDIHVINSLGKPFDQEAIRLYSEMPNLIPASINEIPIEKTLQSTVLFGNLPKNRSATAYGHFQSGFSNYEKGKYAKAVERFTKAISLNPTVLDYYFNRALTLIETNEISKACEDLNLIKLSDKSSMILFKRHCN